MKKEDRAGLELTIIVHLVVLVALLLWGIGAALQSENTFVLDFSREEEIRKQQEQEQFQEDILKKVDDLLKTARSESKVRNIATGSALKDDRNSGEDARKLYEDAAKLAKDLQNGYKTDIEEDARNEVVQQGDDKTVNDRPYSGPSVLRWTLDGRKASHLPIPAYRCYGAGEVSVAISVDPQGNVVAAKIIEESSDADECLQHFAIRAARLSKFSKSTSAPARQVGEIVYSFVAQ